MRCVSLLLFILIIGFTVGDELGFPESLSNVEGNRRRSTQNNRFQNALIASQANQNKNMLAMAQPMMVNSTADQMIRHMNMKTAVTVPPFKPIPPAQERPLTKDKPVAMTAVNVVKPVRSAVPVPALMGIAVPAFEGMPASISRISLNNNPNANTLVKPTKIIVSTPEKLVKPMKEMNNISPEAAVQVIKNIPEISNISMEAIEAAIIFRQQQLAKQKQTTTTTQPTTTHKVNLAMPIRQVASASKVMNAPKEYYPVGYDKNFDDNFASKVELPDTTFSCGTQKHFPGLYADTDLGCMVFHVCALTDDGLIMKSFLCPESTLFDQTILKCNWWFYVDCKSSEKLYDSNIPISKSYQLMKALTFFSAYNKKETSTPPN